MLKKDTVKHFLLIVSFCLALAGGHTAFAGDSTQSHSTSVGVVTAIALTVMGPQSMTSIDELLLEEITPPLAKAEPGQSTDVRQLFNVDNIEAMIAARPDLSELFTLFLRAKDAYYSALTDSEQSSEEPAATQAIPPQLAKTLLVRKHERAVDWLEFNYELDYEFASTREIHIEEFKATLRAEMDQHNSEGNHSEFIRKREVLETYARIMDGHPQALRNEAEQSYKTRLPLVHSSFDRALLTLRYREQALQRVALQQSIAQQAQVEAQAYRLLQLEDDYHQNFMALLEASRLQEDPASAPLTTALRLRYQPGYTVPQSRIDYIRSMDAVEKLMAEKAAEAAAEAEAIASAAATAEILPAQDTGTGNDEPKHLVMLDMPSVPESTIATPNSTAAAESHTGYKIGYKKAATIASPMAAIYPLEMRIDSGDTEETLMYRYLGTSVESLAKHAASTSLKLFRSLTTTMLLANADVANSIVSVFAIEAGADFVTKDQELYSTIAISAVKTLSRFVPYASAMTVPLAGSELFMDMAKRFVHKASLADHSIELVDDDGLLNQIAYVRFNMPAQASAWYDHFFGESPTTTDPVQDLTAVVPYIDVAPVSTESAPVTDNQLLISLHQLVNTLATNTSIRIFPLNATASAPGQLGYAFALVQMDESGEEHYSRLIEISGNWGAQGSQRWLTEALAAKNLIRAGSLSSRLYDAVTSGSASLPTLNPLVPELIQAIVTALSHYIQSDIDLWNGPVLTFAESADTSPVTLMPAVTIQSGMFAAAMETGSGSTIFFDEFASQYQAPLRATLKYVGINQVDSDTLGNMEQQRIDRYPAVAYGMQPYNPVIARLHTTLYKTVINQATIYAAAELMVQHMFPVDPKELTFGLNGGGIRPLPRPSTQTTSIDVPQAAIDVELPVSADKTDLVLTTEPVPVVATPVVVLEAAAPIPEPVMSEKVELYPLPGITVTSPEAVLDSPVMTEPTVLYPQGTFDARHYTFGTLETTTEPATLYPDSLSGARHYTFGVLETTTEPEVLAPPMQIATVEKDGWRAFMTQPLMPKPLSSKAGGLKELMETYGDLHKNRGFVKWMENFLISLTNK